jgi:hypothetical protein
VFLRYKDRVKPLLAGPVLYQTSGFLAWQYEVYKFVSKVAGRATRFPPLFRDAASLQRALFEQNNPRNFSNEFTSITGRSTNPDTGDRLYTAYGDAWIDTLEDVEHALPALRDSSHVPFFSAALPVRRLIVNEFWQNLSDVVCMAVVALMCLPALQVTGLYHQERARGILQTLRGTGTSAVESMIAWWVAGSLMVLLYAICCALLFAGILYSTSPILLFTFALLLGFSALSFGFLASSVFPGEYSTLTVLVLFFVTMLPGLLYFDLAESRNRTSWADARVSLLPSSAFAIAFLEVSALIVYGFADMHAIALSL